MSCRSDRLAPAPELIDPLWRRYHATRSAEHRNAVALCYARLLNAVSAHVCLSLAQSVDYRDMQQAGMLGLLRAVERFQPDRGTEFVVYAWHLIRGAMLDCARLADAAPRLLRRRSRQMEQAREQLLGELGHEPTAEELRRHLGVSDRHFALMWRDRSCPTVDSLNTSPLPDSPDAQGADVLSDRRQERRQRERDSQDLLQALGRGLGPDQRLVLMLYYGQDLTMRQVGQALGLCEARISQIHTQLLAQLRDNPRVRRLLLEETHASRARKDPAEEADKEVARRDARPPRTGPCSLPNLNTLATKGGAPCTRPGDESQAADCSSQGPASPARRSPEAGPVLSTEAA